MRIFWLVVLVALGGLWYFYGLRLGVLTFTPAWMLNAQGTSSYKYRLLPSDFGAASFVRLTGSCDAQSGSVTIQLVSPSGQPVGSQVCQKGAYSLSVTGTGENGDYVMNVVYRHYTGRLELTEQRQ